MPRFGLLPPLRHRAVLARPLDQGLLHDDRLDDHHAMIFDQHPHLVADRSERAKLDLNQTAAGNNVDAMGAQRDLELDVLAAVQSLEVTVQGGFHVDCGQRKPQGKS